MDVGPCAQAHARNCGLSAIPMLLNYREVIQLYYDLFKEMHNGQLRKFHQ